MHVKEVDERFSNGGATDTMTACSAFAGLCAHDGISASWLVGSQHSAQLSRYLPLPYAYTQGHFLSTNTMAERGEKKHDSPYYLRNFSTFSSWVLRFVIPATPAHHASGSTSWILVLATLPSEAK
jgi:hypothetical protein